MDDPSLAEPDRQVGFSWRTITSRRLLYFPNSSMSPDQQRRDPRNVYQRKKHEKRIPATLVWATSRSPCMPHGLWYTNELPMRLRASSPSVGQGSVNLNEWLIGRSLTQVGGHDLYYRLGGVRPTIPGRGRPWRVIAPHLPKLSATGLLARAADVRYRQRYLLCHTA